MMCAVMGLLRQQGASVQATAEGLVGNIQVRDDERSNVFTISHDNIEKVP